MTKHYWVIKKYRDDRQVFEGRYLGDVTAPSAVTAQIITMLECGMHPDERIEILLELENSGEATE